MLGKDDQMQTEFVDFQKFAKGLVLLVGRLFSRAGSLKNPIGGISPGL